MTNNHHTILQAALDTLSVEITALEALRATIADSFCNAVTAIFHSNGRLVVTGIGKSAIIAQKMVATFNSTGTPALFMHAADAIHGDLGMIRPADIVLCISKSGETPEIKVLVPILKNLGNQLISLSANADSYLARQANFSLLTPIEKEADPNNLAPTASTIAQMAMGDAMAVALLSLRGFSSSDFAQIHPGGALGKQLYLRVRDLILLYATPAVTPDASIHDTILTITSNRLGATAVVDTDHHILGIITDGDLRRMLQQDTSILLLTAKDIMHPNPKIIDKEAMAIQALELLRKHAIMQLIVVDEQQRYIGMIHLHDLLKEGLV
ncbi:MAG: KpsF/GutQ family sugar-phosphate isomerase [Saprospiraceae bacterium]|nr:KpsF/GutQ family sugar-phosphate isomerase [Saprospiraceae bacterium]MBP7679712.1 KpsF/GutQ family sugar-phosphate isomerase [Saprospiraceae bacterium]